MKHVILLLTSFFVSQAVSAAEFLLTDFIGRVVIVDQKDAAVVGRIESQVDASNSLQLIATADFEVRGRPFKESCDISLTKRVDARVGQVFKARCLSGHHIKDILIELPTDDEDYGFFKSGSFMTGFITIRDPSSDDPMVIRLPVDIKNLDASP